MGLIEDIIKSGTNPVFEDDIYALTTRHNKDVAAHNSRVRKDINHARETGEDREKEETLKPYLKAQDIMRELETFGIEVVRNKPRVSKGTVTVDYGAQRRLYEGPAELRKTVGARANVRDVIAAMMADSWHNVVDVSSMVGTSREQVVLRTQSSMTLAPTISLEDYNVLMARCLFATYDGYRYDT